MRFSILISITLLFTVFGFCGTPVHADGLPGQFRDISITNSLSDIGIQDAESNWLNTGKDPQIKDLTKDFETRDITGKLRVHPLAGSNGSEGDNRASYFAYAIGGMADDKASCVIETTDGGIVVVGDTASYGVGANVLLMKFNNQGSLLWARTAGDIYTLKAKAVVETPGGDLFVTGGAGFSADYDPYIMKFSGAGDFIWTREFRFDTGSQINYSIDATSDNGCVVSGKAISSYSENYLPFIVKFTSNGSIQWVRFRTYYDPVFGSNEYGAGKSVQQCSDGGYILAGDWKWSPHDENVGFLQKYASNGDLEWTRDVSCGDGMEFNSVKQTSDGGFIVTGQCDDNLVIIKLSSDGSTEWAKYAEESGFVLSGVSVYQCDNDWFVVSGGPRVFRFHSSGTFLDGRYSDGGSETRRSLSSIQETADSGYVMVGNIYYYDTYFYNMLLIKTNSNVYVPDCEILEAASPGAFNLIVGSPFAETTPLSHGFDNNFVWPTITAPDPDIFDICATPTPTVPPTSTWTPVPPTNTPTPTSVGCSILCLSSDYSLSQVQTGPALVSTGLLSPMDISHFDCESSTPVLADLIPYDAILVWSRYAFRDQTALGDVLRDYVDQGGGLVIAPYAFTDDIVGGHAFLDGNIMGDEYSPFRRSGPLLTSGRLAPETVLYPGHPYFSDVALDSVVYTVTTDYSEPQLNSLDAILHAQDTGGYNLIAENSAGNICGVNIYPGILLEEATLDSRLLVTNMLLTVSGCNATPTATPIASDCSILCLSSDYSNSIAYVEPALVSTGLLSSKYIFHMNAEHSAPVLADLLPYDAILFWSFEALGESEVLGNVLKDYVDAGGGVVLAAFSFTSDLPVDAQIAGAILDPGYCPFLPDTMTGSPGQMSEPSVTDPGHAYFDAVDTSNVVYEGLSRFSNPILNDGGVLLAQDTVEQNFLAENIDGSVGAISLFPGTLDFSSSSDDTRRLVANMLMTVSGCNAEPTVSPTPFFTVTPTPSPTAPSTETPIPTDSPTPSATAEPTGTPVPPTDTPVPTDTPTEIPTDTPTPTETPTLIPTDTPVPTMTSTPSPACIHHGDVTGDGGVTAADAQLAFEIVMELVVPSFVEECAADCNGDGSITAGDAQQIFGVIFGGSCVDPLS